MAEVDLVLDTDVMIEILRQSSEALAWAEANRGNAVGLPMLVRAELLAGARDKNEQRRICRELDAYASLHIELEDSSRAIEWFEQFHLSHGLGVVDCLIAASAVRLHRPLCTFNVKHFQAIPGLRLQLPYQRT